MVFPAAGFQHTLMKKEFTPEGMIFGHNTLYFDNPSATPMQKEFVAWYADKYKDYPNWEADRAYFAMASYKAAVEEAAEGEGPHGRRRTTSSTPWRALGREARRQGLLAQGPHRRADLLPGHHDPQQRFDFATLDGAASRRCTRPTCRSRPAPTSGSGSRRRRSRSDDGRPAMSGHVSAFGNILLGGIFHAAVLFLVAAGLQLVFGVQKIVNLACGSFYALGAYFGITLVSWRSRRACRRGCSCRCC